MNYKKHYETLCGRAKTRLLEGYTEKHHVIPRCMGGDNSPDNIVELTPEEHYVAHQLLVKMHPDNKGLVWAAHLMTTHSKNGEREGNKLYGWLRKKNAKLAKQRKGKKNGSYGRSWYYNPTTLETVKCLYNEVPEGYIKGRVCNTEILLSTCRNCETNYKPKKPESLFCSKKCANENRKKQSKRKAYSLLREYVESEFDSINRFAKSIKMEQQTISRLWQLHVDGFSKISKKRHKLSKDDIITKCLSIGPIV